MEPYVTIVPSQTRTRVLLIQGPDELLRAVLPPLSQMRNRRAVTTLLEALSLWLDARLCVALSADEPEASFCCGLRDELYAGARSVFYAVQVVKPGRRRRGIRLQGVAEFGDVRQLRLLASPEGTS